MGGSGDLAYGDDKVSQPKGLTWQNQANIGAFIVNVVIVFGSQTPIWPLATNTELSQRFTTLITPTGTAFSIWGIIFGLEGMFTVAQALPALRDRPVINVVTPWWLAAQFSQVLWSILFASTPSSSPLFMLLFSQVVICILFLSLAGLLLSVEAMKDLPAMDELLLTTGFSIHTGWVMCATAINFAQVGVVGRAKVPGQLAAANVCLATVFALGAIFATALRRRPNFWVPLVVAWASFWINQELAEAERLRKPREFFINWSDDVIEAVRGAAAWLSVAALVLAGVAVGLRGRNYLSAQGQSEKDQESEIYWDSRTLKDTEMGK